MSEKRDIDSKQTRLSELLMPFSVHINYVPQAGEVPYNTFTCKLPARHFTIAADASLDPVQEAQKAQRYAGSDPVCIFLPGTKFDTHGTRKGRGGGWYDRFLSHVPIEWYRVGFCFAEQFSNTSLARETWDEGVDVVCVVDQVHNTLQLVHADKPRIT